MHDTFSPVPVGANSIGNRSRSCRQAVAGLERAGKSGVVSRLFSGRRAGAGLPRSQRPTRTPGTQALTYPLSSLSRGPRCPLLPVVNRFKHTIAAVIWGSVGAGPIQWQRGPNDTDPRRKTTRLTAVRVAIGVLFEVRRGQIARLDKKAKQIVVGPCSAPGVCRQGPMRGPARRSSFSQASSVRLSIESRPHRRTFIASMRRVRRSIAFRIAIDRGRSFQLIKQILDPLQRHHSCRAPSLRATRQSRHFAGTVGTSARPPISRPIRP